MYHYVLLQWQDGELVSVKEERKFSTLDSLQIAVKADLGFVPSWLLWVSDGTYLQEEAEEGDDGFVLDIEGVAEVT